MCSKGGGSPPVPSAASTTFNSTVQPSSFATPLYQDFLNRANTLSNTPFNPAQLGQAAPLNAEQTAAGGQLFDLGMHMGDFDPAKVTSIMSPFTEQVVGATQNWFNNQNAIQGNDLLSQAIKSGNAFGGDRAGAAEGVLAGQQQLAQAPVIAGLRQAGYTQALDEYNRLKTMGLQGAGAALGWGSMEQAQQQKEFDVAQQNAMMQSAYPFQTLNWYGSLLGGVGPLLGQTAFGSNNPPEQSGLAAGLGAATAGIGLASSLLGSGTGGRAAAPTDTAGAGGKRGGVVEHFARGGLVPVLIRHNGGLVPGLAYGGSTDDDSDQDRQPPSRYSSSDIYHSGEGAGTEAPHEDSSSRSYGSASLPPPPKRATRSDLGLDPLSLRTQAPAFPVQAGTSGAAQQPQKSGLQTGLEFATKALPLATSLFALSDRKTKTDVQRIGRDDDGEPLYGFRYRGDPKTYPKVVGPMATPHRANGGGVTRYANGGGEDDDQLTMTDLGVLDRQDRVLSPGIAGPGRGSPAGGLPQQAEDMSNLARVRERFRPMLEGNQALRSKFDVNTTAEAGANPAARDFYQALTLDRAAARGESLPYTLSRGPGTPDRFYPGTTMAARTGTGRGVSPALWGGANPANFGTGNASRDPITGRDVGFGGGPQTGSVGAERGGVEGPDLAAARRFGYRGPSTTAIGFGPGAPQGTYGGNTAEAQAIQASYPEGEREKAGVSPAEERKQAGQAGPGPGAGTGAVGSKIPGAPPKTWAQNLAGNPFWQLGTALMAKPGIKGRELSAVGGAAQSMSAQQIEQRKQDLLENKPELLQTSQGIMFRYPDGTIAPTGLKSETAAQHEFERKTQKPFQVESEVPSRFGSSKTVKKSYRYDEDGNLIPVETTPQQQGAPAGQRQRVIAPDQAQPPASAPAAAPATAPAPATVPAPGAAPAAAPAPGAAPAVRQTEAAPAVPAGPTGWSQDPATGLWRDKEGATYDQTGKQLTAPTPKPTQTAQPPGQQQQPPLAGVAGPEGTLKRVEGQWGSGAILPGGAVTNPAAMNRNPAALEGLEPDDQRIVKAVADYSADPNKLFPGVKNTEVRNGLDAKVREYDSNYNPANLPLRAATRKAYEATGVEARTIQSQDMAVQHADNAIRNIDRLNHSGRPWWNEIRASETVKNILGSSDNPYQIALGQTKQDIHAVSNELMKVFRGGTGQPSEKEAKRIADTLKVTDNPEVLKGALREGATLLYGRVNSTAYRYNDAMGPGFARPTESWFSPEGRAAVQRIFQGQ